MNQIINGTTSLADATCFALGQLGGISAFVNAAQFAAIVRDVLDSDSIEARVFFRNCDDELLAPFAQLAGKSVSADELQLAAAKVSHILYQDRMIDGGLSESVSTQLMEGVARYLGMSTVDGQTQHGGAFDAVGLNSEANGQPQDVPETPPHVQNDDVTQSDGATPKVKKGVIIGIAAAVVATAVVLALVLVPKTAETAKMTVTFSSGASTATGVVEDVAVPAGEAIALPENGFEWKGHEFAGWLADPNALEPLVLQPGAKVRVDGPAVYQAVWRTTVVFDGNGADKGETKNVLTDANGKFVYPECGYTREGYMFTGWSDTADSDSGYYQPGEEGVAHGENHLYAAWMRGAVITDVTITQKDGTTAQDINGWRTSDHDVLVRAKNDTDALLTIDAKFEFLNDAGSVVSQATDYVNAIAPGETVILQGYKSDKGEKKGVVNLNCTPEWEFYKPLVDAYKVEKESADSTHLVARVTNTSSEKITIERVALIGKDANGNELYAIEPMWVELEPGRTSDIVFDDNKLPTYGAHVAWDKVDPEFYVHGYIYDL